METLQIPSVNQKKRKIDILREFVDRYLITPLTFHKNDPVDPLTEFVKLIGMAKKIESIDPVGLPSLILAILRPIQSEHILSVASNPSHGATTAIEPQLLFFNKNFFSFFDPSDCIRLPCDEFRLQLNRHVVLPTPWVRTGFASALATIGKGKKQGDWRQDINHRTLLLLPWCIGFVHGGNHSITAGILAAEGEIVPTDVCDLSPLLERLICDGTTLREKSSGRIVAMVENQRTAAVFEIGRIMQKHKEKVYPFAKNSRN